MPELGVRASDLARRGGTARERAGFVGIAEADRKAMVERALAEHPGERVVGAGLHTHDKEV